jgi:hypothetical protein
MDYMENGKKPRKIQIPEWMEAAVSELAEKDKRTVNREIEFLVEQAVRNCTAKDGVPGAVPVLTGNGIG